MIFLNYLGVLAVSYLGLILGFTLIKISPEELKPGRKYFKILQLAILFAMVVVLLFNEKYVIASIAMILLVLLHKNTILTYIVLGAVLGLTSNIALASLIFLYGLPTGSLVNKNKIFLSLLYLLSGVATWFLI